MRVESGWDSGILLAPPTNGGNLDEQNQFQGLIRIAAVSLGTMTDGTSMKSKMLYPCFFISSYKYPFNRILSLIWLSMLV